MDLGAFGMWWDTFDWGTVPAWVGSILTSVSVFLALLILFTDKKKDRRAMADSFVTWLELSGIQSGTDIKWSVDVHAFNAGSHPIPYAAVLSPKDDQGRDFTSIRLEDITFDTINNMPAANQSISPKASASTKYEYAVKRPDITEFIMMFSDGAGKVWFRRMNNNKYMSTRQGEKLLYAQRVQ
jgi:hypothetical protein